MDANSNEAIAGAAFFVGTVITTIISYIVKKAPTEAITHDAVVAGVGLEFGNRLQIDQLIGETKRCADCLSSISVSLAVLADRKQEAIEDKIDEMKGLLERLAEKERRG